MQPDFAISVEDASKTYRLYKRPVEQFLDAFGLGGMLPNRERPQEFHAINGISIDIRRGTRLGVVGRNGAGKTTFLKMLTGAVRPTKGRVEVNGTVVALLEIGVGFHPEFTGYENIRSSISYNGLADSEVEAAVSDILEFCELGPFLHQPLKTYSLGMKSRLYFACATAVRPDILIIDEVLGAGDSYFAIRSQERMQALTRSGSTLLLVSHSIQQILQYCDEAIWIEAGKVVMRGRALDVVKAYEEFIRVLDEQRRRQAPGGVNAVENEWLRQFLVEKAVSGAADVRAEPAEAAEALGPERPIRPPSPVKAPEQVVAEGGLSRWPGEKGIKIIAVDFRGESGPDSVFDTGGQLDVELTLRHEIDGPLMCRYSVLVYTPDLRTVCRFHSPEHSFRARTGDVHTVALRLSPLLLSNGEYLITVGVYGGGPLDQVAEAARYDNLSLSYKVRVIDRIRTEGALFHHPCAWSFSQDPLPETKPEWVDVPFGAP